MKIILRVVFFLSISISLYGCVKQEILDEINLIEAIGFDSVDNGNIEGTVVFPVYIKDQKPINGTFSAEAKIKKVILQEIQRQASSPIVTGSMEVVLFEKDLAKNEGILELIDPFQRDPGVGSGLYVVVVDGKTRTFLEGEYGISGNATHISNLIEHNIKNQDLPRTNLQRFLSDFYQEGKTPFVPQLKQVSKGKMEISGISLFEHGKITDTIRADEMFFFKLLVDKYSEGLYRVRIGDEDAAVRSIRSSHNYELTKRSPMVITIYIKVQGIINEFTGESMTKDKTVKLEKEFEKIINEESEKLIQRFQRKMLDPLGLGHFVKTQTRNFDIQKWRDTQYKDLVVKVQSDVTITETGVTQ